MESSRRDLLNDMAERTPILKNNQNKYYPVLISYPKQVEHSRKQVFCFNCEDKPLTSSQIKRYVGMTSGLIVLR